MSRSFLTENLTAKIFVLLLFVILAAPQLSAVSFVCVQSGPTTWVYNLTFAPLDNVSVFQSSTTITITGLTGVIGASGPTSTDFPLGQLNTGMLNWTAQVLDGGTKVVWTNTGVGTGNFGSEKHVNGFTITTAGTPNGTVNLTTNGVARDLGNALPGGAFNLDINTYIQGPAKTTRYVLPQLAFGGGWYTAVYFSNTNSTSANFQVLFRKDDGSPLVIPGIGTSDYTGSLPAGGTGILEAANTGVLTQGSVVALVPPGMIGYGVFRQSVPGAADQEAVVPFTPASSTQDGIIWDDTNYVTAVAILNPSPVAATVGVTVKGPTGNVIGTASVLLNGQSKSAVVLKSLPGLAGMAGNRGTATFSVSNGNVSVLGLRFFGLAFTSIPAATN
jgi:hypothetical protein